MWALKIWLLFILITFLLQYCIATQFSEIVHNSTGLPTHLTEPKYYISALRYASSNHMVYFSPHALYTRSYYMFHFIGWLEAHIFYTSCIAVPLREIRKFQDITTYNVYTNHLKIEFIENVWKNPNFKIP